MATSFRGKVVLSVSAGLPAPLGSGTPKELVVDSAGVTAQPTAKFDLVVCASAGALALDAATIAAVVVSLRPGGEAYVQELVWLAGAGNSVGTKDSSGDPATVAASSPRVRALRDADGLRRALLYAGLAPPAAASARPLSAGEASSAMAALYPTLASAAASGSDEARDALDALTATLAPKLGLCAMLCTRPEFKSGSSFSLRSRSVVAKPAPPPATPPLPPPQAPAASLAAWTQAAKTHAASGARDAPELINEDDLLAEEDMVKKEVVEMDCGTGDATGKRKACKNCSCGLREMLENEDANAAPPAKSSCGNCALGDAYRCDGCPHRGKPAFVDGVEVKLADTMLGGQAVTSTNAPPASAIKIGTGVGNVVKLSLGDTMDTDL